MAQIAVRTSSRTGAYNITDEVARTVHGKEGALVHLFTLHTTCGLIINEDADPNVMRDIHDGLDRLVPKDGPYRHAEGNSDAHIKSCLVGHSLTIPFSGGKLVLGTWQGIFLMEFDGPRERHVHVSLV